MRAAFAVLAGLCAACNGHRDRAPSPAPIAIATLAPAAAPIVTCQRYAAMLDKADDLDVDPEVRTLLRDEAAFVRAAALAPSAVQRDELTVRCAGAMLALGRIPTSAGVGGLGAAYPPSPAPPALPAPTGSAVTGGPHCRHLFETFDRVDTCADIPDDTRATFRQQRALMVDAWSQVPQDPDVRNSIEEACRITGDSLTQILSQYHCP